MYAEMTTDAFPADDFGLSSFIENDSLMSAIIAGYAASSTTDTEFAIDFREHHCFSIQFRGQ